MEDALKFDVGETYYEILGCAQSASNEQISNEYRVRAKIFHPDKYSKNDEETKNNFQR